MAAPTVASTTITEPGVYDLAEDVYQTDPVPDWSLSASGARKLLPPSCPARYLYEREHGRAPTAQMELGSAAHKLVLGEGSEIEVVDADDWRTKAAKEARAEARERGAVPLLTHEWEQVQSMAAQLERHPVVPRLFTNGTPEQSMVWRCAATGVWCRARLDWLPEVAEGQRMILADYKTTQAADPESLQRTVYRYGYHIQAAWYLDGVRALGLADDAAFVFVFQEKEPPWLVSVVQLDAAAMRIGSRKARQAREIFARCLETGVWPDYTGGEVELLALPAWAENREGDA